MQRVRLSACIAAAVAANAWIAGTACGPAFPTHDGYPEAAKQPWKKPAKLALDGKLEAEVEGSVSYEQRNRARWYAVELPTPGELAIKFTYEPLGEREFDLAFEVLGPNFNVLTTANAEDDDAKKDKKERTLYELAPGTYYVHVYTQGRMDAADFTLDLKHTMVTPEEKTDFPAQVAYVDPLAVVPAVDDAPPPTRRPRRPRGPRQPKQPDQPEPPTGDSLSGRIAGYGVAGGKTKLIVDRGSNDGVSIGWRGQVVSKDGRAVRSGGFTVSAVRGNECEGMVSLSVDDAKAAGRVILRP